MPYGHMSTELLKERAKRPMIDPLAVQELERRRGNITRSDTPVSTKVIRGIPPSGTYRVPEYLANGGKS